MSLTIDASVWVPASLKGEATGASSREFLTLVQKPRTPVHCPVLGLAECSGALARATR